MLLGLVASAALLSVFDGIGGGPAGALRGPVLSDCQGTIRELAIHYVREAADGVGPTYRDFLCQLPEDVTVHVVCPDRASFEDLLRLVGPTECVLSPVIVAHPVTAWSTCCAAREHP